MPKIGKFIKSFFEVLGYLGSSFFIAFERSSFEYKMLKIGGHDPERIWQGIRNLENRKLLKRNRKSYSFTKKGIKWAERMRFQYMNIKEHPWDHKWRVIVFDIPESLRSKRHLFRAKLKSLGFCMIQKSVFVVPFKCNDEITYICDYLRIEDYVNLLICESLDGLEPALKKHYNLG